MKELSLKEIKVIGPGSEPKRDNAGAFFLALPSDYVWRSVISCHSALTLIQELYILRTKSDIIFIESDDSLNSASFSRPGCSLKTR
jgi:hypothetical protein